MNLFGARKSDRPSSIQAGDPETVVLKLDMALTSIFSEDGKRAVIYHMKNKFGLSLEQAGADPARLEKALTGMLGEIGWTVVKRAILEELWEKKVGIDEIRLVESASLREAFGFVRGLSLAPFFARR